MNKKYSLIEFVFIELQKNKINTKDNLHNFFIFFFSMN